jgi:gamma-glutamyltranspeptidase/glutathione hydrolase
MLKARKAIVLICTLPLLGASIAEAHIDGDIRAVEEREGRQQAVSAADPRAQAAGETILDLGGSAVDAAIAVMLALTVVEPQSSGIGGGGFMLHGSREGDVLSYDGRETAPSHATDTWFLNPDGSLPDFRASVESGLSVGVPGNIKMAAMVHRQHGKLLWSELFAPAIELARNGYSMNQRLYDSIKVRSDFVAASEQAKSLYFDSHGEILPPGTIIQNPELADAFEIIASLGPDSFYQGALADQISRRVARQTPEGTGIRLTDLRLYEAKIRDAVCGTYRGYRICSMGPPSSGGIAILQILGQLERFDLRSLGVNNFTTWHLFLESQRLAYADREIYIADPDFIPVPTEQLINANYLARRGELISPIARRAIVEPGAPEGHESSWADGLEPEEQGTSHFSVVDLEGNMVSYTSTIESAFGSGIMANGFFLNNELTDFSRIPAVNGLPVANRVEAGKRPRSSMAPTVIWDPEGEPFMVVGAAGGATIPVSTARAIIGVIDFDLSAQDALALPFAMANSEGVLVEAGTWLEDMHSEFVRLGYDSVIVKEMVQEVPIKVNAILRQKEGWISEREPRVEPQLNIPSMIERVAAAISAL